VLLVIRYWVISKLFGIFHYNLKSLLKTYQTKLTNLTAGNKSLLHLKAYKYADLDLNDLDFLNSESSIKILEKVLLGKSAVLCAIDDPRSEHNNEMSKRIRLVASRVKFIENERGTHDLYLGYPFVEGKLKNDFLVRCPLCFIPVKIEQNKNQWLLSPNTDAPIKFNKSFLLAYAHYHQTKLDSQLENLEIENLEYNNLRELLTQLYQLLKDSSLEINFNQELFEEKLKFFYNTKKADFEAQQGEGMIKLQPYAVLGIYPQSGSELHGDYDGLIDSCEYNTIEDYFSTKTIESIRDKEESFYAPFAIDASQEEAIKLLRSGQSLVVQGPPGTGKSQLIAQVVADYIANGKKVLITCDKRVALDVVYQQRNAVGVGPCWGLVHDYNTDRKQLYEKIALKIESLEQMQQANSSYQSISQERDFVQVSRRIAQIEEELDAFKLALYDNSKFGLPAKDLYLLSNDQVILPQEIALAKNIDNTALNQLISKLKFWLIKAQVFENENFALVQRKSFHQLKIADKTIVGEQFKLLNLLKLKIKNLCENIFNKEIQILEFENVTELKNILDPLQLQLQDRSFLELFLHYSSKKIKAEKLQGLCATAKELLQKGILPNYNKAELQEQSKVIGEAIAVKEQFLGGLRFSLFFKKKNAFDAIIKQYHFEANVEQLKTLKVQLRNTILFIENYNKLPKAGFVVEIDDIASVSNLDEWQHLQENVLSALDNYNSLPTTYFSNFLKIGGNNTASHIQELLNLCKEYSEKIPPIKVYFKDIFIADTPNEHDFSSCLNSYFDEIYEFDKYTANFSDTEKGLAFMALKLSQNPDQCIATLKMAVYKYWIYILEEQHPVLKSATSGYIQALEDELIQLIARKQSLSREIVLLKASENTYKQLEYNRLGNRTTYRDLLHETTKKKKILSVRQLFEAHQTEILQLIPCWLASPETVSAILPNQEIFDLVIFDEASQCFTEEAIPSLFRAKQVLVAGDSKQLTPNDLYRARWEDEDENIDEQTHSFLDLACRYLPQTMLCEHYRSLSYSLIKFSNEHFYRGKLRLIPELSHYNQQSTSLEYVRVYGVWQNQSNFLEAIECVRIVKKHLLENAEKSIGVIAFNFKQQELIQELLLDASLKENFALPESLFVKNIENVQGDERDIILFSVGYAPNEDGKMVSSFGSLGMNGGENRLNVAITRAKEKMYVLASILPQQLNTENSKNQGPALLKAYLQYAWQVTNEQASNPENCSQSNNSSVLKYSNMLQSQNQTLVQNTFSDLIGFTGKNAATAIFTDDDLYFQSRSAKEIHGYVPQTLRSKNWSVQKHYSRANFKK
jgi:superfamily I DNA and/or RNA helicase